MSKISFLSRLVGSLLVLVVCTGIPAQSLAQSPTGYLIGLWNTNLEMVNILELVNNSSTDQRVGIAIIPKEGATEELELSPIDLLANSQRDINLNETYLLGHENSYGSLIIFSFENASISGRISSYRWNSVTGKTEIASSAALGWMIIIQSGPSAVIFNSNQPSLNVVDADYPVEQWLSIFNLGDPRNFTIETYNAAGNLVNTQNIRVGSAARRDIPAGISGLTQGENGDTESKIGLHLITPEDVGYSSPYIAQLNRYGRKASSGTEYSFALSSYSSTGSTNPQYVSISKAAGAENWIEITNGPKAATADLYVYDKYGTLVNELPLTLAALAQVHLNSSALLAEEGSGYLELAPREEDTPLLIQSLFYYRDNDGRVAGASIARSSADNDPEFLFAVDLDLTKHTSYNLYLNAENWLRLFNPQDSAQDIVVTLYGTTTETTRIPIHLAAHTEIEIPLHQLATYKTQVNTYGSVDITGNVFGELLRLGKTESGEIDFAMSIPLSLAIFPR